MSSPFAKNKLNISPEVEFSAKSEVNSNRGPIHIRKRKDLSVKEKLEILKHYDRLPKMSQRSAAIRLNISQPVLGKILKNRNLIENMPINGNCIRKRARGGKEKEIESALKLWYVEVWKRNMPINGNLIREKAKELGRQMGKEFAATCGWLTRWRKRENIIYNTILKRKTAVGAKLELDSLKEGIMDSEPSENISGANTSLRITGEKCNYLESVSENSLVSCNINPVAKIPEESKWEADDEHICEVFIKTESNYEYESEQPIETSPTDKEMLEALTVLSAGVKLRTSNLKLHYEYESFIKHLLKGCA